MCVERIDLFCYKLPCETESEASKLHLGERSELFFIRGAEMYVYLVLQVYKAEHQYNLWHSKSEDFEVQLEKLQHVVIEKDLELARLKELCLELQSHVQELKHIPDTSVEEDIINPG
jgi:hypothetical protein